MEAAVNDDGTLLGMRAKLIMDQGAYPAFPFPAAMFTGLISCSSRVPTGSRGTPSTPPWWPPTSAAMSPTAARGRWRRGSASGCSTSIAHELGIDPADMRRKNMVHGGARGPPRHRAQPGRGVVAPVPRPGARAGRLRPVPRPSRPRPAGRAATWASASPPSSRPHRDRRDAGRRRPVRRRAGPGPSRGGRPPPGDHRPGAPRPEPRDDPGPGRRRRDGRPVRSRPGGPRRHPVHPVQPHRHRGSRAATWASGAVLYTTRKVKEKVLAIAAEMLEISPEDLEINDGIITPKGVPQRSLPLAQIATQAYLAPATPPRRHRPVLEATETTPARASPAAGGPAAPTCARSRSTSRRARSRSCATSWSRTAGGSSTRRSSRARSAAVWPRASAACCYEHSAYDERGQFLAGTFMDYLLPTATEIPTIEIDHFETEPEGETSTSGAWARAAPSSRPPRSPTPSRTRCCPSACTSPSSTSRRRGCWSWPASSTDTVVAPQSPCGGIT